MSLNYKLDKIDDFQTVCYDGDGKLKPITESLIFATMAIELGEISESNAGEFYARIVLWTRFVGPFMREAIGNRIEIPPEDVVAHIGLYTNVVSRTRHQWFARMVSPQMNDHLGDLEKLLGVSASV